MSCSSRNFERLRSRCLSVISRQKVYGLRTLQLLWVYNRLQEYCPFRSRNNVVDKRHFAEWYWLPWFLSPLAAIASLATVACARALLLTNNLRSDWLHWHTCIYTLFSEHGRTRIKLLRSQCCMRATVKCTQTKIDCYSAGPCVNNNDDVESDVIDYDSKRVFLHHIVRTSARLTFNANATLGDTQWLWAWWMA